MDERNEKRSGEEAGMSGSVMPDQESVSGTETATTQKAVLLQKSEPAQDMASESKPESAQRPVSGMASEQARAENMGDMRAESGPAENPNQWGPLQEPRPMEKKKKWILAGVAVAVLAVSVTIIALAGSVLFQSDQKRFIAAFIKSEFSEPEAEEDVFGFAEIIKAAEDTPYVYGSSLQLDGSNFPEVDQYRGMGLTAEIGVVNTPVREMAMKLMVEYGGMDVAGLLYHVDPQMLKIGIPGLSDKVLTLDYQEGFEQRVEDSYMVRSSMSTEEAQQLIDLLVTLREVMNNPAAQETVDAAALAERLSLAVDVKSRLEKEMDVKREGNQSFLVDGKSVSCTEYRAVIYHDTWMALLKELEAFILEDEQMELIVFNYISQLQMATGDSDLMMDDIDDLEGALDVLLDNLDEGIDDIEMTGFIDRSGRMVSLTVEMEYSDGYDTMEFTEEILWKGGDYMAQNMEVTVSASDGYEDMEVVVTQNGSTEGDTSFHDYKMVIKMNGVKALTGTFGTRFDRETKEASLDAMIRLDSMLAVSLDLKADGVFDQIEKGKSTHFTLDNMTLRAVGMTMDLSGEFYVKPTDALEKLEGESFDLLTSDEDLWYDFAMEILDHVDDITRQFDNSGFD